MPEGDTIFRTASTLHRALSGSVVTKFETELPALSRKDLIGRTVEFVRATEYRTEAESHGWSFIFRSGWFQAADASQAVKRRALGATGR